MNQEAKQRRKGFTLIELMLALSFISVLLVAIALTVIQISNIYNRGTILKEINQTGRSVASELQKAVSSSAPFDISSAGGRYIQQGNYGGRLCLGKYSYVWNYGKALYSGDQSNLNVYEDNSEPIRFVRVIDPNVSYCTDLSKKVKFSDSVDMLSGGERNLVIHGLSISSETTADDSRTGQRLYVIELILGTNDQEALVYRDNSFITDCKPPSDAGSDIYYCAVNRFNIVARAGNAVE